MFEYTEETIESTFSVKKVCVCVFVSVYKVVANDNRKYLCSVCLQSHFSLALRFIAECVISE